MPKVTPHAQVLFRPSTKASKLFRAMVADAKQERSSNNANRLFEDMVIYFAALTKGEKPITPEWVEELKSLRKKGR